MSEKMEHQTIEPARLNQIEFSGHHKVLSLDCFDTIFWRAVSTPQDIFFLLQEDLFFKQYGISATDRVEFENQARKKRIKQHKDSEVSIQEIYQSGLSDLGVQDVENIAARMAQIEIEYEIKNGYIFNPIEEFLDRAKEQGLKVIIISDIYFSQTELAQILSSVAPSFLRKIDAIYTSSSRRKNKTSGLFELVLKEQKINVTNIIHVGDNLNADFKSPSALGISAFHLKNFTSEIEEILDARRNIGLQLLPAIRYTEPFYSTGHSILAKSEYETAGKSIGFDSVGAVLYNFSKFIKKNIELETGNFKIAFLMRDGLLPMRAFQACYPELKVHELNISRFTAYAASIKNEDAIKKIIYGNGYLNDIGILANQFMFEERLKKQFIEIVLEKYHGLNLQEIILEVALRPRFKNAILQKSMELRKKLKKHIEKYANVSKNEKLILVDLGYAGTVQKMLQGISDELGVSFSGLYLLTNGLRKDDETKKGLIDNRNHDPRLISTLLSNIRIFETVCSSSKGSVIGYTDEGDPILSPVLEDRRKDDLLREIQQGVVTYCKYAQQQFQNDSTVREQEVIVDLGRFLYSPIQNEIENLSNLKFDLNLGSDKKVELFDLELGLKELEDVGVLYSIQGNAFTQRSHLPYEFRHANYMYSNTLMLTQRYTLFIPEHTLSFEHISIQCVRTYGENFTQNVQQVFAYPTYNGFYRLHITLSPEFNSCTFLLGERLKIIQLKHMKFDSLETSLNKEMNEDGKIYLEGFKHRQDKIFTLDKEALVFIKNHGATKSIEVEMVFRPL